MSNYNFYAGYLRFVAQNTSPDTSEIRGMMAELGYIANILEQQITFTVEQNKLHITARALAGVAGFLQQHILPETIDAKNISGEREVRWVIDTSMTVMSELMVYAELADNSDAFIVELPQSPPME
jgi:hypothetical protein